MSIPVFNRTITDAAGNVVPNAQITVVDERTDTLATLFDNRDGDVGKSNPFTADINGFAQFFAAPGVYRVTAEFGALSRTWRFESLLDNAVDIEWNGQQTFTNNVTGPGALVNGKYPREIFMIPGRVKAPSASFPALCLTAINTFTDISATNWPILVPELRAQTAVYLDGLTGQTATFAGSASGNTITLTNTVANNALLAILVEHAAAFGDDFSSLGTVGNVGITGVNPFARQITCTAAPGAGPYTFYPHRIAGSTTTARVQSWRGRSPVGANGEEGGTVSGYVRRDQTRRITGNFGILHHRGDRVVSTGSFSHQLGSPVNAADNGGGVGFASISFNSQGSPGMAGRTSATTGEANATHPSDVSTHIYMAGGVYNA
jgi:hypothetical protein